MPQQAEAHEQGQRCDHPMQYAYATGVGMRPAGQDLSVAFRPGRAAESSPVEADVSADEDDQQRKRGEQQGQQADPAYAIGRERVSIA
jgi:hypothetical protein